MAVFTYSNNTGLALPDSPAVSQTLLAFGQVGTVTDVGISLADLTHTFPDDIDMLLVAPNGINNLLFMSDAGGGASLVNVDLTFSDSAATTLPDTTIIAAGSYRPTDFGALGESDADFGSATGGVISGSNTTFATAFGGIAGNGNWSLFVDDDLGAFIGSIAGWSVAVTTDSDQAALSGTAGADSFTLANQGGNSGTFQTGGNGTVAYSGVNIWTIDGGAGTDSIFFDNSGPIFSYSFDLTSSDLTGIENFVFQDPGLNGFATVTLNASEIGNGFAANGTIVGNIFPDGTDTLAIVMGADTAVSLNAITFSAFNHLLDVVTITGDADAEVITGGSVHDVITGNGGDDQIFGVGGDDLINGNDGFDILSGGNGLDEIHGGLGDDELFGGNDSDHLSGDDGNDLVSAGAGDDFANGGIGNDTMFGAAGADFLSGAAGADTMTGGTENDIMLGGDQGDTLFGQDGVDDMSGENGNDVLSGGNDADSLYGGANADQLLGGGGDDFLDGGTGNDTMTGGGGADDYFFTDGYQADTAQGFTDDLDELHLDDILWGGGLTVVQMLTAFAAQTSPGIVTFNFGGGDTLTVVNGGGISLLQLSDDIVIV